MQRTLTLSHFSNSPIHATNSLSNDLVFSIRLIMFEKLLEKLLLTYFGPYVHGIDPNNLHVGIWSGDIKI